MIIVDLVLAYAAIVGFATVGGALAIGLQTIGDAIIDRFTGD